MNIGNWVSYTYKEGSGTGFCIGEMRYSRKDSQIICIATVEALGMPINLKWCKVERVGDLGAALLLRKRYEERFPGHLKPLVKKAA